MKFNNQFDFQIFLFNLFSRALKCESFTKSFTLLLLIGFILLVVSSVFISVPFQVFYNTQATQKAINQQCKTNYTFNEVLFASENLLKLCQTKQQTIVIK